MCLMLLLSNSSCIGKPLAPRVSVEDTTWIVLGKTTRDEVVTRFGRPDSSSNVQIDADHGDYAEYGPALAPDVYEGRGYTSPFEPRPRGGGVEQLGGAQPQVFRPPLESIRSPSRDGPVFWVLYDPQGVVKDFGFRGAGVQWQPNP